MPSVDQAVRLAEAGFYVFPVIRGGKAPAVKGWRTAATRDTSTIRGWWDVQDYNVGIDTSRYGDSAALIVVDVDTKGAKHGEDRLVELEMQGLEFPVTLEHATPSGGRHLLYRAQHAAKQGVDVLGSGLDIRSDGGYVVGPGSVVGGKAYAQINGHGSLAEAPGWLVSRLGSHPDRGPTVSRVLPGVDRDRAVRRGVDYLLGAPVALEGEGGNQRTYVVAAQLKDFGVGQVDALELILDHWNPRCQPPWSIEELTAVVGNAYRYGREPQGAKDPGAVFPPVPVLPLTEENVKQHPIAALNSEYAFIKAGAFIVQETTDPDGKFELLRLTQPDFHAWFANRPFAVEDRRKPISKWWIESDLRRQYDAVVFAPGRQLDVRWYNLWRGFTVEPAADANHPAVAAFLHHALENVCGGERKLFRYLMAWFAHMIQRPGEKPLVATVFQGGKGTGKNALVERVGALLGAHFLVADDDRYLLSNFNGHMEHNLFMVLDEAAWAGNKKAEGRLKGLITGARHNIERKGYEPVQVPNLTRVSIIGNEDWLVPASTDERRFAVFTVGNGNKQDRKFFHDMRVGMEQGGYANLLRYLLDFDLTGIDVNDAPSTAGLMRQKIHTMDPQTRWWFDCLYLGEIAGGDWGGEWPERVPTNRMQDAARRWARDHNIRQWSPTAIDFGIHQARMAPSLSKPRVKKAGSDTSYAYHTPGLDILRAEFCAYINGPIEWPT